MDRYRRMATFVAVVQSGSLRKAAREHVEPEVAEEMAAGQLVRVLPEWTPPVLSVDALMPARTRPPAKIRLALDVLRGYLERAAATPSRRGRAAPARPRARPA